MLIDVLFFLGSVRAFRGLRYNSVYAAKLEKKKARQEEKETARLKAKEEEEKKKAAAKVNPFSVRFVSLHLSRNRV